MFGFLVLSFKVCFERFWTLLCIGGNEGAQPGVGLVEVCGGVN